MEFSIRRVNKLMVERKNLLMPPRIGEVGQGQTFYLLNANYYVLRNT